MKDLSKEMRAYALRNAIEHGKAVVGKVLPKLFNHGLSKDSINVIMPQLNEIISWANSLSAEEREKEFEIYKDLVKEREVKEKTLPEFKGNVVMRFKPSPSGPLHVGHSYVAALNSEIVKKNNGKFYLWIDDTNPDNIYPGAYDLIPEDMIWLTLGNITEILVQSDHLDLYYKKFEALLELDYAYICDCDPEKFKELLGKGNACPCRGLSREEQKNRWKKMFKGYKKGDAVARLKTDLKHKNPAMRDFPLFRINDANHARQKKKYRVWPLMNMAVAIDDLKIGSTHVIRAKDHADNAKRQEIIHQYLGQKTPETLFVGKINFEGMPMKTSKTKEDIANGKYSGWDDIRLPTLLALRRRGFQPEALAKYATEVGISRVDKTVDKDEFFKAIEHFNKEVIDIESDRYFFVAKPKKLKVKDAPEMNVSLDKYPGKVERGTREFKTSGEFYVSGLDEIKENKNYRLMHLFNFRNKDFISESVDDSLKVQALHWLPVSAKNVKVRVLMPDGKWLSGLAEAGVKDLKVGAVVQFERFGFVRLDAKKKGELEFWFAHK